MSENLMSKSHKASTKKSRENHDRIFGRRCEYHTTRKATTTLVTGLSLCDECLGVITIAKQRGLLE